jgi:predicted permease
MLLTLGVSLSKMHPESLGRSVTLSLVRLGLGVSAGLLLTTLLGVEGLPRKVLVLQASMPVGVLNYLFAQRYARSPEQVASLVLVSTLLSVVSIPVLLAWL